jgi:hypothetical protein
MGRFWALPLPEVMENLIVGRQLIKNANDNSSITKPNSRYSAVQYLSNVVGYVNIWTKPGYWDGPPCLLCLFSRVSCESATRGWILLLFRLTTVTKYSDTDKQTNRQTDKQTNRQTDKHANTNAVSCIHFSAQSFALQLSPAPDKQHSTVTVPADSYRPEGRKSLNSQCFTGMLCFALPCFHGLLSHIHS